MLVQVLVNGQPALIETGSGCYMHLPAGSILKIDEGEIVGAEIYGESINTYSGLLEDTDDLVVAKDQVNHFPNSTRSF